MFPFINTLLVATLLYFNTFIGMSQLRNCLINKKTVHLYMQRANVCVFRNVVDTKTCPSARS